VKDRSNRNTSSHRRDIGEGLPAIPVRAQKPKDLLGHGGGKFCPGKAPIGGFQGVWNFSNRPRDFKNSPATKPEKGHF
jgi:hypothetical protein